MKTFPYWEPTVVKLSVNFVVICCFLLGACELIHVFVRKERNCNGRAKKIRRNRTKLSSLGGQALWICGSPV